MTDKKPKVKPKVTIDPVKEVMSRMLELEAKLNANSQQLLGINNSLNVLSYIWRRAKSLRPLGDAADFNYDAQRVHLFNTFASHPQGEHIISANVAQEIVELMVQIKPKTVIEIGTGIGCCTAFVSYAAKMIGIKDFKLKTIEATSDYIVLARQLIPIDLQENVEFLLFPDDPANMIAWEECNLLIIDGTIELTAFVHKLQPRTVIFVEKRLDEVNKWQGAISGISWQQKQLTSRYTEDYIMRVPKAVDQTGRAVSENGKVAINNIAPYGVPVAVGVIRDFKKGEEPKPPEVDKKKVKRKRAKKGK